MASLGASILRVSVLDHSSLASLPCLIRIGKYPSFHLAQHPDISIEATIVLAYQCLVSTYISGQPRAARLRILPWPVCYLWPRAASIRLFE